MSPAEDLPLLDPRLLWTADARPGRPVQLAASRCTACGRYEFLARDDCPACFGAAERVALGEEATLIGFTAIVHQPPDAVVEAPYVVGVARFEPAGIAILGIVHGARFDDLEDGMRVRSVGLDVGGAVGFAFELVTS